MRTRFRVLPLVIVLCALPALASAGPFSMTVVFGDSLSDTGNFYQATGGQFPVSPPYAQRFSNGPVAVEQMAQTLGVPLQSFAFGGATTGAQNVFGQGLPGMRTQFDVLFPASGLGVDPDALYVVWGGPNNFLSLPPNANPATVAAAIGAAVGDLMYIVDQLLAAGAQHILVPGMPNLGATPRNNDDLTGAPGPAAAFLSANFNQVLFGAVSMRPDVIFFDTQAFLGAVLANPAAYLFTNVIDACKTPATPGFPGAVCSDPDGFLFFDDVHPTTRAHGLLGVAFAARVLDEVPEPASVVLLVTGLAAALARRRLGRG